MQQPRRLTITLQPGADVLYEQLFDDQGRTVADLSMQTARRSNKSEAVAAVMAVMQ